MSGAILFVGFGRIARRHLAALRTLGTPRPLAVATADPARAAAIASRHRMAFAGAGYAEAIADPRVDTVFISLPPAQHFAQAAAAFAAGKNVVLEKPAALGSAPFRELMNLATAAGRQLMVTENHSFMPSHQRLRSLVRNGAIGPVREVHLTRSGRVAPDGSWRFDPAQGPGALLEGGVHWIRRMRELACPDPAAEALVPWEVVASLRTDAGGPVELSSLSLVRFGNGVAASLAHSWTEPRTPLFAAPCRMVGDAGVIKFLGDGSLGLVKSQGTRWLLPRLRDRQGFATMWRAILASLDGAAAYPLSNTLILSDLEMIEQCYRLQAAAGLPVNRTGC